jgi:hypothetical protein
MLIELFESFQEEEGQKVCNNLHINSPDYKIVQPDRFVVSAGLNTALMASSSTVFNPFWVNAEHSMYLMAPSSLRIDSP